MEDMIALETATEGIATAALPGSEQEQKLADEIVELWTVHEEAKTTVTRTREELKAIRMRLGERLARIKELLVKPGRKGGWSSFLRTTGNRKGDRRQVSP